MDGKREQIPDVSCNTLMIDATVYRPNHVLSWVHEKFSADCIEK